MLIVSWNVAGLSTTSDRIHEAFFSEAQGAEDSSKINFHHVADTNASVIASEHDADRGHLSQSDNDTQSQSQSQPQSQSQSQTHPSINSRKRPKKTKSAPSLAIAHFLKRHHVDILCVQEHKIPRSKLSSRCEPRGCAVVEGYESFWSCNSLSDKNAKGMNGAMTYVRQGMVVSANSNPLGDAELDRHGRCVMTDHGDIVIFNVYVPASGQPVAFRMKFLIALRNAIRHQRDVLNKKVILAGDLNIARGPLDRFWRHRLVLVDEILDEVAAVRKCQRPNNSSDIDNGNDSSNRDSIADPNNDANDEKSKGGQLEQWKRDVAKGWPKIADALKTQEVVKTQTTNPMTNQKYERYRMSVHVSTSDGVGGEETNNTNTFRKRVFLGNHEPLPDYCLYQYAFDASSYVCPQTNQERISLEKNAVCVDTLAELQLKIAGIRWDDELQRHIADTIGGISKASPPRAWLNALIEEDKMVDTFRHFYPSALGRFTCWNQSKNRRYFNEGGRIDYILVDETLRSNVQKGDVEHPRCCGPDDEDPFSDSAALNAATANGQFQAAAFDGGGIQQSSRQALESQFGIPHTGMIYTPPTFSDHIAISVLLDDDCIRRDLELNATDKATKLAQPHKAQRSIMSFFGSGASQGQSKKVSGTQSKIIRSSQSSIRSQPPRKRKAGIQNFFLPKRNAKK